MRDPELDRFITAMSVLHYAAARYGYRRDRRESNRACHVLRHPATGDKIVRRDAAGHWTYFSVRDDRDDGTLVDFVQRRTRTTSLREVRDELRHWLGAPPADPDPLVPSAGSGRDPASVEEAFAAARAVTTTDDLAARGLRRQTLADPRFAGTWRQDRRGNALFTHCDDLGELTGFEIKNRGFTRFSPGGTKSVWQSTVLSDDRILVIAESVMDAWSHHGLHPEGRAVSRYLSTAGTPSARQWALLDRLFAALARELAVVAAVDADAAGDALAAKLEALTGQHGHLRFRRDAPAPDKEWNDVLQRMNRERGSPRTP